jgi:hypothetical protein
VALAGSTGFLVVGIRRRRGHPHHETSPAPL